MFRMILQLLYVGMPADFKRRFFEESPRAHVTASFLNQVDLGSIPFPEGPPSAWTMVRSGGGSGGLHQKLGKRPLSKRRHTVRRSRAAREGSYAFVLNLAALSCPASLSSGPPFFGPRRVRSTELRTRINTELSARGILFSSVR